MNDAFILARPSPGLTETIVSIKIPSSEKKEDFIFVLFKKLTNMKAWQLVGQVDGYLEITDPNIRDDMKASASINYKVNVVKKIDRAVVYALECTMNFKSLNKYALVASVNYDKMLKASDSEEFVIFHTSLQGEKCTCWDNVRMESSDKTHVLCGGSGFLNGFEWVGKERFALLNSNKVEVLINEVLIDGTIKPTPMQAWTTGRYIIKPGYIIVGKHSNIAYEITLVSPSFIKDSLIRQEVSFREVEQGSPIYVHIAREGEF